MWHLQSSNEAKQSMAKNVLRQAKQKYGFARAHYSEVSNRVAQISASKAGVAVSARRAKAKVKLLSNKAVTNARASMKRSLWKALYPDRDV